VTPYYEQDGITIYHGDSKEFLPLMSSADLILTDPPYGVGKAAWDDEFPVWWFEDAARIAPIMGLMPGVVNLLRCPRVIDRLKYRWTLAVHICNGMTRGAMGYGNWIPCLVYAADGAKIYKHASDVGRVALGRSKKPDHPSPKPYEVMQWLVERLPGTLILDPFMGSGTTLLAAYNSGRQAIGIEIEEKYCEIAANRLRAVQTLEKAA
jgi:DNA modification methylase